MPRGDGRASDALRAALASGEWMLASTISAAVDEEFRDSAPKLLFGMVKGGHVEKRGERGSYEYRAVRAGTPVQAAADAAPPSPATQEPASLAPGLGQVVHRAVPENQAQGTIGQALRILLDGEEGMTLDEILEALPIGWSRAQALSGLHEAANDGWLRVDRATGVSRYLLIDGPASTERAVAVAIVAEHGVGPFAMTPLRSRVGDFEAQARQLLADACSDSSPRVLVCLAQAHASIHDALQAMQ
jgi:hypothetical protein